MRKFERNDRVKCTSSDIEGCEGIILEVKDSGYKIKLTKIGDKTWQKNWYVGMIEDRDTFWKGSLELISKRNEKPTHIILNNIDYIIAFGEKDRDERVKELVDNKGINNDNITIYDIKNESKIKCKIKYLFFHKHHIEKAK